MTDADEMYLERAAIAEYDGGLSRADAEALAEQERHRHEVNWICAHPERADPYLAQVAEKRGKDASEKLRADAREQYRRGNRGQRGDWR